MNINDIEGTFLTISEMAQIQGISRQTLIYYDRIGLFCPDFVDENGYRYYNSLQIPFLKEICFLKSIGIALEDIKLNNKKSSSDNTIYLLERQEDKLNEQLNILKEQKKQIKQRVEIYKAANEYSNDVYRPTIEYFPERKAVWVPWNPDNINRKGIHETLLQIWNITAEHGYLPSKRWGAALFKEYLDTDNILQMAGGCTFVPKDANIESAIIFPAGYYVCMDKYGMPYETEHVYKLLRWIKENNYRITGDIYDECIMDSIFYGKEHELDFCQLQIPIEPINK
jgi:DNA-binding transcriptional MerR regulator